MSDPAGPLKVPKAASTYTTATQDPELRSSINGLLLKDGHITKIHDTLLHALHAHPTNWPTLLQTHALSLLRSGTCTTFPDLMTRVLQDIKDDTEASVRYTKTHPLSHPSSNGTSHSQTKLDKGKEKEKMKNGNGNGVNGANGNSKGGRGFTGKGQGGQSLALPRQVVEEGVRITRECLEEVCVLPSSDSEGSGSS